VAVLVQLSDAIWVAAASQSFLGLRLGTRMTLVRRADGGVIVHSPIRLDEALRGEIEAIGPVRCVIAPNLYPHLYAGDWAAAFPGARLVGVRGLDRKRKDLRFDAMVGERPDPGFAGTLQHILVRGSLLRETVFFHAPTRTLVCSDLVENFATSDHWPTRWYLEVSGLHGQPGVGVTIRPMYCDRARARAAIERVLTWDIDRIVLAHGDVIETDGREVLRASYSWL
jgi:hypothetical protein